MLTFRDYDMGWIVGLLEGEGCFTTVEARPGVRQPCVKLRMTDRDVVEKFKRLFPGRTIVSHPQAKNKTVYSYQLRGKPAVELMEVLEPLMMNRRAVRIREILDWWSRDRASSPVLQSSSR